VNTFPKAVESCQSLVYKLRRPREDTCPGTVRSSASFSGTTATQMSVPLAQPCPVLTLKSFGKKLDNFWTVERRRSEGFHHNRQDSCVPRNSMSRLLEREPSSDLTGRSFDSIRSHTNLDRLVDRGLTREDQSAAPWELGESPQPLSQ